MNNYEWSDDYKKLYEIIVNIRNDQTQQIPKTKKPRKPRSETYYTKVERLAKTYPAIAEAKAHLDALVIMVEHGE
jgi:hypothetical protein